MTIKNYVLIVAPTWEVRQAATTFLIDDRFIVATAAACASGSDLLKTLHPDVVLLDTLFLASRSEELVTLYREVVNARVPVLLLNAAGVRPLEKADVVDAQYLRRPLVAKELLLQVYKALEVKTS